MGARLEQEARPAQPPDGCGVLGSASARLIGDSLSAVASSCLIAAMRVRKSSMTASSASEYWPISDALLSPTRAMVASTAGHALRHELDDDAPAIGGIGDPAHIAGLLQAIDDAGDRAGRQAREVGQHAGGRRAAVEEHLERLDVGLGQAEPEGHRVAEQRPLEVDAAQGAEDGIDQFAVHG